MSNFQGVSPVLLYSSCNVLENNSAVPDYGQLQYPFRKAIILDEIRWTMRFVGQGAGGSEGINLGALVSTRLQVGQKYLMRDNVPIWLLGTTMNRSQEEALDDDEVDPAVSYSHYRWRLPEPLYLDAGEVLASTFYRGIDGFGGSVNTGVSYVGRTVAPKQPSPKIIPVPYVAPWTTPWVSPSLGGTSYAQSNEKHLFNPFDVPVRVQRFTGRILVQEKGDAIAYARTAKRLTPVVAGSSLTVQIFDSWGGKVVNDRTGPSDVFDLLRAAWTVDTIMPPKGVYEVRAWDIPAGEQLHVAIVGVREERL